MGSLISAGDCRRARELVSLQLDGEASEVERKLLAVHLAWCDDCRTVQREQTALAAVLRSAPSELPERLFVLPSVRRRVLARPVYVAAAAAVLAAAVGAGTLMSLPQGNTSKVRVHSTQPVPRRAELALANKIGTPDSSFLTGRPPLNRPWRGIYTTDV